MVGQWRHAPVRHMHGFVEADIFRQGNFQNLAAEFAKKSRKFHYFEIPTGPMQTDYDETFS